MEYVSLEVKCTRPGMPEVSNCDILGCCRPVVVLYHYSMGEDEIWVYMCEKHASDNPITDIMKNILENDEVKNAKA